MVSEKIYDYKIEDVEKIAVQKNEKVGNTISNINNVSYAVEDEDYIYSLKDSICLCRSDKDFTQEETLIKEDTGYGI